MRSTHRKHKLLNGAAALLKPPRVFSRPLHAQIEPTTYCNLNCPSCPRADYVGLPRHMSAETFAGIVDNLEPSAITLSGLGEVLMNPELFDMIAYAASKRIHVNTTSNFTMVTEEQIDRLLESRLDQLYVSVDAATPAVYRAVRQKDSFRSIVDAVGLMARKKRKQIRFQPELRLCFVVQSANVHEMASFYELAATLGVDSVQFQIYAFLNDAIAEHGESLDMEEFVSQLDAVIDLEHRQGRPATNAAALRRKLPLIRRHHAGEPTDRYRSCVMPFISLYVSVEGDVRPCCLFAGTRCSMGTLDSSADVMDIYNGEQFRSFRTALRSSTPPHRLCAQCLPDDIIDIARGKRRILR